MQKLDGVESVKVSLNDGLTILDLRPGNRVTLAKLRQVIKDNGFVPKEAQILARGAPATNGPPVFDVRGTNERLVLTMPARPIGDDWHLTVGASSK
jgi:hypothetical protein